MISLKCWNSGVESNGSGFITSYTDADPLAASFSFARCPSTVGVLCLSGKLFVSDPASDNLLHDAGESLRVSQLAGVVAKRLFVNVGLQMCLIDVNPSAFDSPFEQIPEAFDVVRVNTGLAEANLMVNGFVREV